MPAFAAAALVFGALHLANPGVTAMAGATVIVAGLMFCALYALTGPLWVPIGLHFAWNFAQGYLFGATVSGNDLGGSIAVSTPSPGAQVWLTGGTFGPEASVFALLMLGTVTVASLWLAGNTRPLSPQHSLLDPPSLTNRRNSSGLSDAGSGPELSNAVRPNPRSP